MLLQFFEHKKVGGKAERVKFERCAACGKLTEVLRVTPIQDRKTYYPGVGQLCADCCRELYHTDDLRKIPELYDLFS